MLNEVDAPLPHMCRAVGDISDCGMVLWQIGYSMEPEFRESSFQAPLRPRAPTDGSRSIPRSPMNPRMSIETAEQ
jgi:hypothetical protein